MTELIRDTVFGHAVRLMTKGKHMQYAEEKDPKLWKQFINHEQSKNMAMFGNAEGTESEKMETSSGESSPTRPAEEREHNTLHSTITAQRVDTEKGRDVTMVTWYGDNDPEVRLILSSCIWEIHAHMFAEPTELVNLQESLRHFRTLSPYFLRLHRLRHLQRRHRGHNDDIRRQPSQGHLGSLSLRRWLRSRAYDLGTHERDPSNRQEPHLYRHSSRVRHLSGTHCSGSQLRHAALLPVFDWFHRQSCPRDWRRKHRRHVLAAEASIRDRHLGYLSGVWTRPGTTNWWLCCATRRLDMDYLGINVAQRLLPCHLHFLPARNKRKQHPLPAHPPSPKDNRHSKPQLPAGNNG